MFLRSKRCPLGLWHQVGREGTSAQSQIRSRDGRGVYGDFGLELVLVHLGLLVPYSFAVVDGSRNCGFSIFNIPGWLTSDTFLRVPTLD